MTDSTLISPKNQNSCWSLPCPLPLTPSFEQVCDSLRQTSQAFHSGAGKIVWFIKNEWPKLLIYIAAWALIIGGYGGLYGFESTALPLSVGMTVGMIIGIGIGVATITLFGDDPEYAGKNTIWGLLDSAVNELDEYGTRQIVLTVAVTVILAASTVFPHVMGGIFGLVIGNHLVATINDYPSEEQTSESTSSSSSEQSLNDLVREQFGGESTVTLSTLLEDNKLVTIVKIKNTPDKSNSETKLKTIRSSLVSTYGKNIRLALKQVKS